MKATTQRADFVAQRRQEAWAYGRELRDQLMRAYALAYSPSTLPPPAKIIDELLRDFLEVGLHYDPLPLSTFAKTEWRDYKAVVTVNSLTSEIRGVKDALGVQNVAKWHEAIHCHRDQGILRADQPMLLEGFAAPRVIACYRGGAQSWSPEHRAREFFAEEAGRAAAVSYFALSQTPSFQHLVREASRLENATAWRLLYKAAREIGVNVSAVVTQLKFEGWIQVETVGTSQLLRVQRPLIAYMESS
jgi:hypothetical protein